MNEAPQDAWFYTIEGERLGPVGFADLRVKASEGGLNPRLDMIWTHGMEAWKPAGEIDGLFEKRSAPDAPESLAPEAGPYTPPKLESVAETMGREGDWPGVRRRVYLIMTLIFPILWQFGFGFGAGFLGSQLGPEIMGVLMIVAMLLPLVVTIWFSLQRLVNLGMSRWWFLGNLVPILNLWVAYRCFACPAGYAYHKKLDGAGIVLAIIYWLMIALVLVMVAVVVAALFGMIDQPGFKEQILEAIQRSQPAPANR
jgi:hypothetical protein